MAKSKRPDKWDFEGWATRYDVRCGDGETIAHGAFKNMDGETVPLVDDHARGYVAYLDAVVGNAWLQHRDEGVYSYITFNPKYDKAILRKEQVEHGDIQCLSIKANELRRTGGRIVNGIIRDLSIVSAGANPLAFIEPAQITHGDGFVEYSDDEFIIGFNDTVSDPGIEQSASEDEPSVGDVFSGMSEEQKSVAMYFFAAGVESATGKKEIKHSEGEDELDDETIEDIDAALAEVAESDEDDSDEEDDSEDDDDGDDEEPDSEEDDPEEVQHSINGGRKQMSVKANGFRDTENNGSEYVGVSVEEFMDTVRHGSNLSQACIEHGVTNVTDLYDQPTLVNPEPLIVNTPQGWVKEVLSGVKKVPFTKIKSLWTDLSSFDDVIVSGESPTYGQRAKGYPVLGAQKVDEQIAILNRITEPGWMYKRQKLDRDVLYQITSFNFLAWMQAEMGMMLNQELARAILMGDGRLSNDPYKIKEDKVRPIAYESDVWTVVDNVSATLTADDRLDALIDMRSDYQGSGTPTMFVAPSEISAWLKHKDGMGNRVYKSVSEIASLLQVSNIVSVPQLGVARTSDGTKAIKSLIVNLQDYALSMPTGDAALKDTRFDIDFNKEIYLLEWLVGGALITPHSALILTQTLPTP